MFQAILERLLKRVLGEYFEGFDSGNLGIGLWSGEVVIQNVRLKATAMSKLGVPLKLKYSYIRSLKLKIPWKSLTSSKIEIYFDGLYIVVGPQPEKEWVIRDTNLIERRRKEVDSFAEQIMKKYEERNKAAKADDSGFTDRLVLRIIDNLQVQISDIHVRFEDEKEGYAFGLTLQNFKLATVNKNGQDEFIDRSKPEYKNEPLRKRLDLRNLGVYWSSRGKPLEATNDQIFQQQMSSLVQKSTDQRKPDYLILISSEAKLFQRNKGNFEAAETTLEISIKQLAVDLENRQVQQMIYLSQRLQRFQDLVRESNRTKLEEAVKQKNLEDFTYLYRKYLANEQVLEGQDLAKYEAILERMETQEFAVIIRQEIKLREKKKIISDKEVKKFAWISYGKKELSEAQLKEIQKFLQDNFSQEQVVVTRPRDYSYLEVKLFLEQAVFTVGRKEGKQAQGVELSLSQLATSFRKRQTGYLLSFVLADLALDLFQRSETDSIRQKFFYKMGVTDQKYIEISVNGNPPDKPHIDTQLIIRVDQSVIAFTPVFITRLQRFIDLKVNQSNKDKAREKIGEIKDKTSETLVTSLERNKINVIAVDVTIKAPVIVLPFDPVTEGACWCIDTGLLQIRTDESMLDPSKKPTFEKYILKLRKLSLSWYQTKKELLDSKQNLQIMPIETLIKDFEIELAVSLLRNNKEKKTGNIIMQGCLPLLDMSLSAFSYQQLLRLGDCFKDKLSLPLMLEQKSQVSEQNRPQKQAAMEPPPPAERVVSKKKEILAGSQKLGMMYLRSSTTKLWDRYICILKGNFIYLFADKNSEDYSEQVFIRNSTITALDEGSCGRPNSFMLSNKVNKQIVLSTDKKEVTEQWKSLILAKKDEEKLLEAVLEEPIEAKPAAQSDVDFEQLKIELSFEVPRIELNVFQQRRQRSWLKVYIGGMAVKLDLYEARTSLVLRLRELSLVDLLEEYANPHLRYLLESRVQENSEQLVVISILQVGERDPSYDNVDNDIEIKFGLLLANFKPKSIGKLLEFFLPAHQGDELLKDEQTQLKPVSKLDHKSSFGISSITEGVLMAALTEIPEMERVGVRLSIFMGGINLNLVNRNNRLKHGWLEIRSLEFQLKQSRQMTELSGSLKRLRVADSTNYPNTFLNESEYYDGRDLLLVDTASGQETELVDFNIKLLDHVHPGEKKIIIKVLVKDLVVDYFQQPTLRFIHYLLQQMLPSLQQDQGLRIRKPEVVIPQPTDFFLEVSVMSSKVILRSNPADRQQRLVLNIGCIEVRNSDSEEQYCKDSALVLTANYRINISELQIAVNERPLTNDFNFSLNVALIISPEYYKITYLEKFQPGIRINCNLSPFLLRIDNPDFKLVMKCLNCNIAFDDNCDRVLFPEKFEESRSVVHLKEQEKEQADPLYFSLRIDILTVAVSENLIPISNLTLSELEVGFTSMPDRMRVTVTVADIIGSSFRELDGMFEERGIIKQLDVRRMHDKKQFIELKDLVRLFYVSEKNINKQGYKLNDLTLLFEQSKKGSSLIEITLEGLAVSLQMRPLLKLSKVAALDDSVKAPAPKLPSEVVPTVQSESRIRLAANTLSLRAAADNTGQQLGISAQIFFDFTTKPPLNKKQVIDQCKLLEIDRLLQNGRMALTVNYLDIFLLEADHGKLKKRVLLNPTNIIVAGKKLYSVVEDKLLLTDEYIVKLQFLFLEATIKDLIKLKGLYLQAMEILAQDQHQKAPQPEDKPSNLERSIGSDNADQPLPDNTQFKKELMAIVNDTENISEIRAEINIREVKVSVLYESDSIFIPVVQLQLLETNPIFKSNIMLQQLSLVTYTELSFFNPRSSKWEPILEKNSFTVEYVSTRKERGMETTIGVECGNDPLLEKLNINVSSQFLTSLAEVLSELKKQDLLLRRTELHVQNQQQAEELEVSPYVIDNLTFEEIDIILEGATDHSISSFNTAAAPRTTNRATAFDRNRMQQKEVVRAVRTMAPRTRRSIDIPSNLRDIKIRINNAVYSVLIDGFAKRRIGSTNFIVECLVERLNRLIRVVGETITNCTTKDLVVKSGKFQMQLKPGEQAPLSNDSQFFVAVPGKVEYVSSPIIKEDMYVVTHVHCKNKYHYNIVKCEQQVGEMMLRNYYLYSPLKLINCLPKPLQMQVIFHNKTTANKQLKSQQEYEIHSHAKGEEIRMKVSLPNCFWSHQVSVAQNVEKEVELMLKDTLNNELVVKALVTRDEDSHTIQIAFFCQAYIINECPYDYLVYSVTKAKGQHSKRIAGQIENSKEESKHDQRLVIIGYEANNYIKLAPKATPDFKSDKIFIGGLNSSEVELPLQKNPTDKDMDRAVQLAVVVSIKQMHKNFSLLCKEIRVLPRQILVNRTEQTLTMRQEGDITDTMILEPNERQILEYRRGKSRSLRFKLPNTQPSSPIQIDNLGTVNFYVLSNELDSKVFIKLDTQIVDGFVMMVVSLQAPEEIPYLIRNRTKEIVVEVPILDEKVGPSRMIAFSWRDPEMNHNLEVRLHHEGNTVTKFVEINPDRVGMKKRVEFPQQDKTVLFVTVTVVIIGDRRTIEVRSKTTEEEDKKNQVLSTLGVKIATVSLSLVLNHGTISRPYEAFNVTLLDLEFVNQAGTLEQVYQLRLRFLQIDQNYPHLLTMPVVVTPSKFKQFMAKENPRNIINLLIKRNMESTRSILLSEVALEINPLTVRVSELFIKLILELTRQFSIALNTKQEEYFVVRHDENQWRQIKVEAVAVPIYIDEIRISPIDLDISAQLKPPDNGQKQFIMVQMVLKGFGVVVANIDEAPIRLRGIQLKGCFDSPAGLSQKLMMLYKKNIIMEIYKLFGSFNAIGNPASLFTNIAAGLSDLVEKPAEGFVKGPLEGGLGIVQGAHSLVAHTVGGAFNSVSKITGTISSGLSLLAFDKNFEAMRETQKMKKPKNIIQGLEKGAKAIYSGFKEGMTGIFLRPYQEAKKDGVVGFFRGTAQGLVGIIVKPVTGVLDFAADTTEGIKNTALYFEDKPNENRMRCPRVFYGRNSELKEFIIIDAEINNLLQVMKEGRFASSYFLQAFMLESTSQLLAVLDNFLVVLSFKKREVEWYIPLRTVKNIRQEEEGLKLNLSQRCKYFPTDIATIQTAVPQQQELIRQLIEEQLKYQRR